MKIEEFVRRGMAAQKAVDGTHPRHAPQQCPFCGGFLPHRKGDEHITCGKCGTVYAPGAAKGDAS